jgi:hypothetical protein
MCKPGSEFQLFPRICLFILLENFPEREREREQKFVYELCDLWDGKLKKKITDFNRIDKLLQIECKTCT